MFGLKIFDKLNFHQTKSNKKQHFCKNCIQAFSSKEILEKHKPNCMKLNDSQAVEFPIKGSTLEFKSLQRSL